MTHAITYDIFELAKDLKKSKISEDAIDAIVKFEKAKDEAILNNLVTKQDLRELELRIGLKLLAITVIIPTILKILEHFKI